MSNEEVNLNANQVKGMSQTIKDSFKEKNASFITHCCRSLLCCRKKNAKEKQIDQLLDIRQIMSTHVNLKILLNAQLSP